MSCKKKIICSWCEESFPKSQEHEHICNEIFIHKLDTKEITIRGNKLQVRWIDNAILIEPQDKWRKKNE